MRTIVQAEFEERLKVGNRNFSGMKFERIELANKDLSNCVFSNCFMDNCTFENITGKNIQFVHSKIYKTEEREPVFYAFNLEKVHFEHCEIGGFFRGGSIVNGAIKNCVFWLQSENEKYVTKFQDIDIRFSHIEKCDMRGMKFFDCEMTDTFIKNCNLQQIEYSNRFVAADDLTIRNCLFENANMAGASFHTYVCNSSFECMGWDTVRFRGSKFQECMIKNVDFVSEPSKTIPVQEDEKLEKIAKLSGSIVKKINIMRKEGKPVRICPNGQVSFFDTNSLKYFKPKELKELTDYFQRKAWKESRIDESIRTLPYKIEKKLEKMKTNGINISFDEQGYIRIPVLQIHYFTNREIQILNSYFVNNARRKNKELDSALKKAEVARSEKKFRVCPNGQIAVSEEYKKFFTEKEWESLKEYYKTFCEKTFETDLKVDKIPDHISKKLYKLKMCGEKLQFRENGWVILPDSRLRYFTNQEIQVLNSYYVKLKRQIKTRKTESD